VTWKYPSCVLNGEDSVGEFYSVAVTNNYQQADTGTKMIHNGKAAARRSSPRASARARRQHLPGLVRVAANADGVRNFTQCDQLLLGTSAARTRALHRGQEPDRADRARGDHQQDQRRPAVLRDAARAWAGGSGGADRQRLRQEVLQQLPMEFAVEAQKLLGISLEGSVG
jgi:Fe-S cluster assembly protein SufB